MNPAVIGWAKGFIDNDNHGMTGPSILCLRDLADAILAETHPESTPSDVQGEPERPVIDETVDPASRAYRLKRLFGAAIGSPVYPSDSWTEGATKDYRALLSTPPEGAQREPDGWVGDFSNDIVGTALLVVHPDHPQAGNEPYTRPIYIGSPPPEQQTRAAPDPEMGESWTPEAVDALQRVKERERRTTRAETLAEVRSRVRKLGQHASPETVAALVREDEVLAILDRLSSEGAEDDG